MTYSSETLTKNTCCVCNKESYFTWEAHEVLNSSKMYELNIRRNYHLCRSCIDFIEETFNHENSYVKARAIEIVREKIRNFKNNDVFQHDSEHTSYNRYTKIYESYLPKKADILKIPKIPNNKIWTKDNKFYIVLKQFSEYIKQDSVAIKEIVVRNFENLGDDSDIFGEIINVASKPKNIKKSTLIKDYQTHSNISKYLNNYKNRYPIIKLGDIVVDVDTSIKWLVEFVHPTLFTLRRVGVNNNKKTIRHYSDVDVLKTYELYNTMYFYDYSFNYSIVNNTSRREQTVYMPRTNQFTIGERQIEI